MDENGPLFASDIMYRVGVELLKNVPMLPAIPDDIGSEIWRLVDEGKLEWATDRRIKLRGKD